MAKKQLSDLTKKDLLKKFGSALASGYDTNIGQYSRSNTKEDVIQDIQGLGLNQGDDFTERKKGGTIKKKSTKKKTVKKGKGKTVTNRFSNRLRPTKSKKTRIT